MKEEEERRKRRRGGGREGEEEECYKIIHASPPLLIPRYIKTKKL